MSGILDQILKEEQFAPTSTQEYFALQLARRLSDDAAVKLYVRYVEHHSPNHLLHIFHRVKSYPDAALRFHSSLAPRNP